MAKPAAGYSKFTELRRVRDWGSLQTAKTTLFV